jgi:hypothetical protein
MAILISRKVLLIVALLSSLENLLVDGIRGGASSIRRLQFERAVVSPNAIPNPTKKKKLMMRIT